MGYGIWECGVYYLCYCHVRLHQSFQVVFRCASRYSPEIQCMPYPYKYSCTLIFDSYDPFYNFYILGYTSPTQRQNKFYRATLIVLGVLLLMELPYGTLQSLYTQFIRTFTSSAFFCLLHAIELIAT